MARTSIPSSIDALHEMVLRQQELLEAKESALQAKQVEVDAKQAIIDERDTLIDEQASLISFYREWKRLIDSQRFGSSSEKAPSEQGRLFNEAELEAAAAEDVDADPPPGLVRVLC